MTEYNSTASNLQRDIIRSIVPYKVNKHKYTIKLDANESPFSLSKNVRQRVCEYLLSEGDLNIYPDDHSDMLRQKLADRNRVKPDNVLIGVGSDQIIELIIKAFIDSGQPVLMPTPSFSMYKFDTLIYNGQPVELELDERYQYNISLFIEAIYKYNPKVVFICNPNNPTGTVIQRGQILEILKNCKKNIVVVDEAYYEYYGQSIADKINEFDNLVVLRTFSKAYGLAGLRIGYCIAHESMIKVLNKVKPPYNLSSLAQIIAALVLDDDESNRQKIQTIIKQREYVFKALKEIDGLDVFESHANFILFKNNTGADLDVLLQDKGILIRSFKDSKLLSGCYRVTIGQEQQNKKFVKHLKEIITERR